MVFVPSLQPKKFLVASEFVGADGSVKEEPNAATDVAGGVLLPPARR
jgi:hypothetical protein